ncbi:MAG: ArsA family ATPase [Elusimicrobiota bacterium]
MSLSGLRQDSLKLILFGGKGGVGKTTCASGAGIYLSEVYNTLMISTDPAHSLADSIGQKIGNSIIKIKTFEHLSGLEISAEETFEEFKIEHENEIKTILGTSTYMDDEDIESLFALSIPGLDEVMGFKTIVDLIEKSGYDKYIVDTAPTGHALRLLTLPGLLDDWIKVMAQMRWKYRYIVKRLSGDYKPDEGDHFLVDLKKTVKKVESILKDSSKCEFIPVTIPEDMAISETERLVNSLNKYGINVKQLVVNNVLESRKCDFCQAKKKDQEKYIKAIKEKFNTLKITIVPLQANEVKGIEVLKGFKELLFS